MRVSIVSNYSKKLTSVWLIAMSVMVAMFGPMALTNAHAQAETTALNELKEKVIKELDRRLAKYEKTEEKLTLNLTLSKDGASATVKKESVESEEKEIENDGTRTSLTMKIREKTKEMVTKVVAQLETMKEKVQSATSLDEVKKLARNADAQYQVTQVVDLQGALSKAIDSLSGVYEKAGTIKGKLSGQIKAVKQCFAAKSAAQVSQSGEVLTDCDKLRDNANSEDIVRGAESRESGISTIMSAVKTILQSAIALFMALVTAFSGLLGGLGGGSALENLGSLFDVGNLESLLGGGDSAGSAGNIGGLLTSFSSIIPQLTNALGMVSNVTGLLGSLTNFINVIPGASNMLGGLGV